MMVFMSLVLVLIGQFCRDVIGRQNVKVVVIGSCSETMLRSVLIVCFFIITVNVKEDEGVTNTLLVMNAKDEDRAENGKFTCNMMDMDVDTMDTVTVETIPQGCVVVLLGNLEWSNRAEYKFTVQVTDKARPAERKSATAEVTIHVEDTNNHDPTFLQTSYWVSVADDARVGTSVLEVWARDLDSGVNADVRYASNSDRFSVHEKDGVVSLRQMLAKEKKYNFTITAMDAKQRSSAVTVSVSTHSSADQPPKFTHLMYDCEVAEDLKQGDRLMVVATQDANETNVNTKYSIVGGDPGGLFGIDSETGALSLRLSLDYEKVKQHRLVIRALQKRRSSHVPDLVSEVCPLRIYRLRSQFCVQK